MSEDNGQGTALTTVPTGLGDDQLLAVAAQAERRIEAVNKIKRIALKVTNSRDWRDQGGNPYLQVSGSEKVARLFGISWRIDEPTREDHTDGHFSYTVKGYFSMGTAEVEVIGTRSSTDPLFSKQHGANLPPSDIDRNDVKKSAVTNCIGNGITRLLGIRNLTWEDLKEAHIERSSIGRTEYRDGDPNAAMTLPNYGRNHCKGKLLNDASVTTEDLRYYLQGCDKGLADPEKAKWHTQTRKLKAAIEEELRKREATTKSKEEPKHEAKTEQSAPPSEADMLCEDDVSWGQWVDDQFDHQPAKVKEVKRKLGLTASESLKAQAIETRKRFYGEWVKA